MTFPVIDALQRRSPDPSRGLERRWRAKTPANVVRQAPEAVGNDEIPPPGRPSMPPLTFADTTGQPNGAHPSMPPLTFADATGRRTAGPPGTMYDMQPYAIASPEPQATAAG